MKRLLLGLLRVPVEPTAPPGSDETMLVFQASPRYWRLLLSRFALKQAWALAGILTSLLLLDRFADLGALEVDREIGVPLASVLSLFILPVLEKLELVALVAFAVQLVVGYAMVRLGWELRWYMLSDRALRIRHGLFRIHEQTMTLQNIQNMSLRQGPIQRLFGVADLEVRTAGGSSGEGAQEIQHKKNPHIGILEGLDNAAELRDLIRNAVRGHRDAGLGDPGDLATEHSRHPGSSGEVAEAADGSWQRLEGAAATLLDESRRVRHLLCERGSAAS